MMVVSPHHPATPSPPSVRRLRRTVTVLLTNAPGVSVEDLGTRAFNRRVQYARWDDFPRPFFVSNGPVISVRDLTTITNTWPAYSNIFDTVSIRVFSTVATNKCLFTQDLRTADLHNRKFLLRHETNGTNYDLVLTLAPYRPVQTNLMAYTNDAALLCTQQLRLTLTTADDNLTVRFSRKRHRMAPAVVTNLNYWASYLGVGEQLQDTTDLSLKLGDIAALCLHSGKVSQRMVATWAQEYWHMQQRIKADSNLINSISVDISQGTLPYLMGMSYFERLGRFSDQLTQLLKLTANAEVAQGLSIVAAQRDINGNLIRPLKLYHPHVDMIYRPGTLFASATLRPDQGADPYAATLDFNRLVLTEGSALEHKVIEDFYVTNAGVSSVRLLRQSQQPGQPGMLELNIGNYTSYSSLSNYDAAMWQQIVNAFKGDGLVEPAFTTVFITASPVTNTSAQYKGMGALVYTDLMQALISGNQLPQNGGWGAPLSCP